MIGCELKGIRVNPTISPSLILLLVSSPILAAAVGLWSMSSGIGVSPDSVIYISAANSITAGHGLTSLAPHSFPRLTNGKPLTVVPPTYPLLLALSSLFGTDQLNSLRWLHSLLFAINVLLLGMGIYLATTRSILASLCSILLFVTSPDMLELHTMAWSEPAFILFALVAFLLLALHIEKSNNSLLIGSALSAGLALTTRYVGIALLPPMLLTVLLLEDKQRRGRIKDCLILLGTAMFPLAVWLLRDIAAADFSTNRSIAFHPAGISNIKDLINSMLAFSVPLAGDFYLKTVLLFLFGGLVLAGMILALRPHLSRRQKADANLAAQIFAAAYLMTYLLLLFVSISLIDARTPLDTRILSPVYVFGIILVVSVAHKIGDLTNSRALWRGFLALSLALISLNAVHAVEFVFSRHADGSGYTSRAWIGSESIKYIRSLPEATIIYSNATDAVYFLTRRIVLPIPARVDPGSGIHLADFDRDMNAMCDDLNEREALVVYLDYITWRWYLPSKEELENVYKVPIVVRLGDGAVYGLR